MSANPLSLRGPSFLAVLSVAAVFGMLAYGGIMLTRDAGRVAAVWLPNAVVVAILLRGSATYWRLYIPAALIANVIANLLAGDALDLALGLSILNAFEIGAIVWGVRRCGVGRPDLSKLRDLIIFGAVGGVAVPLVSGAIAPIVIGMQSVEQMLATSRTFPATINSGPSNNISLD